MPKPVKKAPKKPSAKKRPSSDPNRRAKQLLDEHMAKFEASEKPWDWQPTSELPGHLSIPAQSFQEQLSAHMAELGRKGGRVSGAKRMEMPEGKRKAIAKKAAAARWRKTRSLADG
jgi:hypothetical protein